MAIILGLEFTTTNPRLAVETIDEFGAILWNAKSNQVLGQVGLSIGNILSASYDMPELKEVGQTRQTLQKDLLKEELRFEDLLYVIDECSNIRSYIVTTNVAEKKAFLAQYPEGERLLASHWIDIALDIPYPLEIVDRSLAGLAEAHGIPHLFPGLPLFDLMTMVAIVSQYDFEAIRRYAEADVVQIPCMVRSSQEEKIARQLGVKWIQKYSHHYACVKAPLEAEFRNRLMRILPQAFNFSDN